jgi:hypothetical protein
MVLPKARKRQSCAYTKKERNWKSDDALGCKTCLSEWKLGSECRVWRFQQHPKLLYTLCLLLNLLHIIHKVYYSMLKHSLFEAGSSWGLFVQSTDLHSIHLCASGGDHCWNLTKFFSSKNFEEYHERGCWHESFVSLKGFWKFCLSSDQVKLNGQAKWYHIGY